MKVKWLAVGIGVIFLMISKKQKWVIPENGLVYAEHFAAAEKQHDMPENLLARVAYQESRFRQDIIIGSTVSGAGAEGLMQIVPRWHPNVNPLNPVESIYYAAEYLSNMKAKFGTWELALAAYNWGPGNLTRKGIENAPRETRNYIADIGGDIGLAA